MPVQQETERCWAVDFANGPDPEGSTHHDTEAAALDEIKTRDREAFTAEQWPLKARQLAAPCWTARCDGECDQLLEDEENGWYLHAADRAELDRWLDSYGWTVTDDGRVFCEPDLPEDARPAPPKDWDVPGQLPLIGKETVDG